MEFEFTKKHLVELYEKGKSKKYPLPSDIIDRFVEVVAVLESAENIYDLWRTPSLNFEKMQGFSNRYSARLGKKWRLEMDIKWKNQEKTIGLIVIDDISSHYGGK